MIDHEMEAMLGAYVLDALDERERAQVEAYLGENPRARAEVDDLRETAAALAAAPVTDAIAPPELWARIAHDIANDAPGDELAVRRSTTRRRVAPALAAAASIVAIALAVQVLSLRGDLDDARRLGDDSLVAAFDRASDVDGARAAELVSSTSEQHVARVVVLPDGRGYLVGDALAALPSDRTYQLWAVTPAADGDDPKVISAGVLGSRPEAASFEVDEDVAAFVLTVEEDGGVVTSTQDPYAAGSLA
ncbi:MAG: anti-sigma factor domain-containing protein [Actinomycetota bacterium]